MSGKTQFNLAKTANNNAVVISFKWGQVKVKLDRSGYICKDCIVSNQFCEEWNWKHFGLRHNPGYNVEVMTAIMNYINKLYDNEIKDVHIILSTGVDQMIQVNVDDYDNVTFLQSADAIDKYHSLIDEGERAILFLHSTC